MVDTESQSYQIARQYMIRLGDEDFTDQERLSRHAAVVGLSPDAFKQRFQLNRGTRE
jgi:6-phosphofructokinase 1